MDRYTLIAIMAAVFLLGPAIIIGGFRLASAWNDRTLAARKQHPEVESLSIGGPLWFPALWTLTDFFTATLIAGQTPLIGKVLLLLAIPNLVLFWLRNWTYPHFFLAKTIVSLGLLIPVFGLVSLGFGVALAIVFVTYLYLAKRPKRTFIYRLNGSIRTA